MIGVAPHFERIRSAKSSRLPSGNLKSIIQASKFDGSWGIGNRLACLDLVMLIGKHPVNDPTHHRVVVYHQNVRSTHLDLDVQRWLYDTHSRESKFKTAMLAKSFRRACQRPETSRSDEKHIRIASEAAD